MLVEMGAFKPLVALARKKEREETNGKIIKIYVSLSFISALALGSIN